MHREFIASYPADILAARFIASKTGAFNVKASISRIENILSNKASIAGGVNTITMMGTSGQPVDEDPILFPDQARFVAPGGKRS